MALFIGGYNNFNISGVGIRTGGSEEQLKKLQSEGSESIARSKTGRDGADSAKTAAAASKASVDSYVSSYPKGQVYKMSAEERAGMVQSMKDELETQSQNLLKMVQKDILTQAGAFSNATGDGIWKFFASGNFTVDAETKQNAIDAISEDGYYGVNKTSQRIFDFVAAMAGDDPEKMKKLQSAVEDGFGQATKAWGKELPGISQDTHDAVNKLFDEYYEEHS